MTNSIGKILKEKRIEKNLSLDDVSKALYIRTAYLEALEHDNLETLLSPVQTRGFARLYADFLDMNIEQLLNPPQPESIPEETTTTDQTTKPPIPSKRLSSTDKSELKVPIQKEDVSTDQDEAELYPEDQDVAEKVSSSDIFKKIGNILLTQREALGITLEEVERHTHLKMHYLKYLEAGEFDNLPSPVQGKGMLNNYARFLELDSEQVLLLFADALQIRREELNPNANEDGQALPTNKRRTAKPSGLRRLITPDLLIGSSIIVLIFVFSIWTISTINAQRNVTLEATPPPISEVLSGLSGLESTTSPIETTTPTPPTALQNQSNSPNTQGIGETQGETIPVKDSKPLQIYIITSDRAWVHVIADKKTVFNGRVQPGNAYAFSAETQIELVTGNAAALQVFFNQEDLGTLGLFGEVSSLVFTDQGILTPTPLFTPTYTPTTLPTLTALPSPTVPTPTVTPFIP